MEKSGDRDVPMTCVGDFEKKAHTVIEKCALDYFKGGAGDEFTLKLNQTAFQRLRIRPSCLQDVSNLDTSCNILGSTLSWPVGIAPTAMQKMAHPDGEIASARAANTAGSVFILSTLSTTSLEAVAASAPDTCKWFQLYVYKDRSLTEQFIQRIENAGYKAIVLTVDAPIFGQRRADIRNNFQLPGHLRLANFDDSCMDGIAKDGCGTSGISRYVSSQFDASLTWNDVDWLIRRTRLPVIVKGVLTGEDATLARQYGCKGVLVSNHGARQIDGVPATIEVLPEIVAAVGDDLTVMMDSGVRHGNDVLKALALGAKYVFVGRPIIWGLACNGQAGVEQVLAVIKKDFETVLALTGCQRLSNIKRQMVVHESYYAKL